MKHKVVPSFRFGRRNIRIYDPGADAVRKCKNFLEDPVLEVPFLRGCEVAEYLGITADHVKKLSQTGRMRYAWNRGRRLYCINAVIERAKAVCRTKNRGSNNSVRPHVLTLVERAVRIEMEREEIPVIPAISELKHLVDAVMKLPESIREEEYTLSYMALQRALKERARQTVFTESGYRALLLATKASRSTQ